MAVCLFAGIVTIGLAAYAQEGSENGMNGMTMDGMSDDDFQITHEMLDALRAKAPKRRGLTDEQLLSGMQTMGPNYDVYVSEKSVVGEIGILGLGHGFSEPGDTQFKEAFEPTSRIFPTAVGYGMSFMTSSHIQSAVDDLVAAGAKTIVVVPTTPTEYGNLLQQWEYIFSVRDDSAYLDVPQVKTTAKVLMTRPPSDSPIIAAIMLDYARELSTDPESEIVIIVAHGPDNDEANQKELVTLQGHAKIMRRDSDFADVKAITLMDDAPPEVRAANVVNLRSWVETATNEGKRVLIVSNLVTTSNVHKKIARDLEGLEFQVNNKGLTLHPLFQNWLGYAIGQILQES